jgi:hypothetical protein
MVGTTRVAVDGEKFVVNGSPTYAGRVYRGWPIEGLLINARTVNAIFDDLNPATRHRWAYPDAGVWDPERNVVEFLAQMPVWRRYGLLGLTINLQGGSPEGYSREQPWHNSAFESDGRLRTDYADRLRRILDLADELGFVIVLGLFYFGQDQRLADERAVVQAVDRAIGWLLDRGDTNVVVEICNECDAPGYEHEILQPHRVHELISRVRQTTIHGRRLLCGTSFRGNVPTDSVAAVSDLLLLHGNHQNDPNGLADQIEAARCLATYRPMPIMVNEDDHFDFDRPWNNFVAALSRYASWGFFDAGPGSGSADVGGTDARGNYADGYQNVPINWTLNTPTKQAFFSLVQEVSGA